MHKEMIRIKGIYITILFVLLPHIVDAQEPIDLGLPSGTLWSDMNVGAKIPEEYGDYYAWGEVNTKRYYGGVSKYMHYDDVCIKKYNYIPVPNWRRDNLLVLQFEDDAARRKLGDNWRMPTEEEMEELLENCVFQHYTLNGTRGYLVKNKKQDVVESIFLPCAGHKEEGNHRVLSGTTALYWTSSLDNIEEVNAISSRIQRVFNGELPEDSVNKKIVLSAKSLKLGYDAPMVDYVDRTIGCVIRPVYVGKRKAGK